MGMGEGENIRINNDFLFTQFFAVASGNTTAVNDPDVVGDSSGNRFRKVRTNVYVCVLRLRRSGDLSSTNGPNWFISNHDVTEHLENK